MYNDEPRSIILQHCWVCAGKHGLNDHHVIPEAYGGVDGPQVTLCASHHTLIHTVALRPRSRWRQELAPHHNEEQLAKLMQLVDIIAKAKAATRGLKRPLVVQHKFSTERGIKLKELKYLLGCSSLTSTLDKLVDVLHSQLTKQP